MPVNTLSPHWPEGTQVEVVRRTGDVYAGGDVVKTVKVTSEGIRVDVPEGRYFAVADGRAVGFTSKETPAPRERTAAPSKADPQLTPTFLTDGPEIITGARGTKVAGRTVEVPVPKGVEPHPHVNQASVSDKTPQRSSTALGQGTPTDPDEPQPKPRQEDVRKGAKQRSETETGEAAVITGDSGPVRQEDFKGEQRSDTETGEATPIGSAEPRGTASNPDSREQAAGERPTDEKPKGKGSVKPAAAKKLKKK